MVRVTEEQATRMNNEMLQFARRIHEVYGAEAVLVLTHHQETAEDGGWDVKDYHAIADSWYASKHLALKFGGGVTQ